jgi:hypothetical protein
MLIDWRWPPRRRVRPLPVHECRIAWTREFHEPALADLEKARSNITSQFGEDGVLARVFEIIGTSNKRCVEFGAWDGKHFSNTWNLIENENWRGVLIECDQERFSALPASYTVPAKNTYIDCQVGWEGDARLDALLAKTDLPVDFDLLSIDVDGNDWHIWQALADHRPRVVIIEYNPAIPNHVHFIQIANPAVSQGSSLAAFVALGRAKGYEIVFTTNTNAVFVRADEFPKFRIGCNAIHVVNPVNDHQLSVFELYDGTIVNAGRDRLMWRRGTIEKALRFVRPASRARQGAGQDGDLPGNAASI